MASRLEEAGRLRARDDDDEANDELMIVEGRRSGGILAPLRTSALARKLFPGPGGGAMVSGCEWGEFAGARTKVEGGKRVAAERRRFRTFFWFWFFLLRQDV